MSHPHRLIVVASILLVECDLRHPTLQRIFGLVNLTGLARLFEKSQAIIDGACQRTRVEGMRVLTSGGMPSIPEKQSAQIYPRHACAWTNCG